MLYRLYKSHRILDLSAVCATRTVQIEVRHHPSTGCNLMQYRQPWKNKNIF